MSASAAAVRHKNQPRAGAQHGAPGWFIEFLRRELAPYPGRYSVVSRMVIAATLTMLIIETFHLPAAALGGFFALLFSRENLRATVRQGTVLALFFCLGTIFTLVTLAMLLDSPVTHFLWVIASFYLVFFIMGTARNYSFASGFSFTLATAIPLWDGPGEVNTKVALTLYTLLSVAIGAGTTILVETVYRAFHPFDPIILGVADRLRVVAQVLRAAGSGRPPDPQTRAMVLQYATVGPSRLRQQLVRAGELPQVRARAATTVALTDRLVELCAYAINEFNRVPADDHERLLELSRVIETQAQAIRKLPDVQQIGGIRLPEWTARTAPSAISTLLEMERTTQLLSEIFNAITGNIAETRTVGTRRSSRKYRAKDEPQGVLATFFAPDAFTNRDHQLFALRGCLAASLCYLVYNGVDWPGISTALATCIITALGTIGASRQKQTLRILGAVAGGFLIALPAQVFLLPYMDSISAFTLFFAAVMVLAAWLTTSSPRLSYFGLQLALAFDLVNLQEPTVQISLGVARDRVVGVLLGLVAMWIVFDQFGGRRAGDSMMTLLRSNLNSLAELAGLLASPRTAPGDQTITRFRQLRLKISDTFTLMNGQADAVAFEFGAMRARDLKERDRMQSMQPAMRSMFLVLITLHETASPGALPARNNEASAALLPFLERYRQALQTLACLGGEKRTATTAQQVRAAVTAAGAALDVVQEHPPQGSSTLPRLSLSLYSALCALAGAAIQNIDENRRSAPLPHAHTVARAD